MNPVRTALVGYGYAGRTFHAPLIGATPELELRVIVSSDAARVHADLPAARVVSAAQAAFDDPQVELVVIATPNVTHAGLASAALACGKHVVIDKPMAVDAAEAALIAARADSAGRLLSVFHNRRYDADFMTLRRVLEAGTVGEPLELESRFDRNRPQVQDRWRERPGPGAGLWSDLGPHLVDQALQLFGEPHSLTGRFLRERAGALVEDRFEVGLAYGTLRVHLGASMLASEPAVRFRLRGTLGTYVKRGLDTQEDSLRAGHRPGSGSWGLDPLDGELRTTAGARLAIPNERGDYRRYYAAVAKAVRSAAANPVTPAEAIAVMRILDRAREAADTEAA